MTSDYKQEWIGCELLEETDDPECQHPELECDECPVCIKDREDFEAEKAQLEAEWLTKHPSLVTPEQRPEEDE